MFMSTLFRERLMHLPLISFLTELWHLLDVSAVAEHGVVLEAILFINTEFKVGAGVVPQYKTTNTTLLNTESNNDT